MFKKQTVHGTEGHMTEYGPVRHQTNIILTELLRSIYYFVGDGPVHILPYDPKWHELFAISYFLSKIIMQVPFRNQIENEAVQSRSI